jgi:hypothetical protein
VSVGLFEFWKNHQSSGTESQVLKILVRVRSIYEHVYDWTALFSTLPDWGAEDFFELCLTALAIRYNPKKTP